MEKHGEENENIAHAYTPGLKIKIMDTVRIERMLPIEGDVLVKVGDEVDFYNIVARTKLPGDAEMLNVTEILGSNSKAFAVDACASFSRSNKL